MTKPIKIYSDTIEGLALSQFYSAMQLDFALQGALMPDAHAGYALPIGAVVATEGVILPSWVGYDIGCGMCAVPTTFSSNEIRANAKAIFDQIYRDVPTGFDHNKQKQPWSYQGEVSDFVRKEIVAEGHPEKQIGTLGGGNHFIEIGEDADGVIWIILHSGSRGVGRKIATHYMREASGDGKVREGHYGLRVDTDLGRDYINDLAFGLNFALANRRMMIERIEKAIRHVLERLVGDTRYSGCAKWDDLINRNHNHAELTVIKPKGPNDPDMKTVWIHRKGATHAEKGMMGVIPGNMRDGSFIVRGKGNPDSLCSSSHGAGRVLSRSKAKETLSLDDFKATMTEAGVMAMVKDATIDESPMAYKDIHEVMRLQADLVDVVAHVKPILNVKGVESGRSKRR